MPREGESFQSLNARERTTGNEGMLKAGGIIQQEMLFPESIPRSNIIQEEQEY